MPRDVEIEMPDGRLIVYEDVPDGVTSDEVMARLQGELRGRGKTPAEEGAFQNWYSKHAKRLGLSPDPDAPEHFYDYRAAFRAGAVPDQSGHWPSEFKLEGHPRMVVDGINTKTGAIARAPVQERSFMQGFGHGAAEPILGAAQLISRGVEAAAEAGPKWASGVADTARSRRQLAEERIQELNAQAPEGLEGSRILGNILTTLPLSAISPGTTVATRFGSGALTGTLGGLFAPTADTDDFWKTKARQGLEGGAVTGAGSALLSALAKTWQAIKGQPPNLAELAALMGASKRHGVPLAYPDIVGGPVAPKMGTALESVPIIGMGGFREAQHEAAKEAARQVTGKVSAKIGGAPEQAAQKSLIGQAQHLKSIERDMYADLNASAGGAAVIPSKTMQQINFMILKEQDRINPDAALLSFLGTLKKNLVGKNTNFENMHALRSDLGDDLANFYAGKNAIMGAKGSSAISQLKKTVTDDMEEFATKRGAGVLAKWKAADLFHKEQIIPFREPDIAALTNIQDPTQLLNKFLSMAHGKPDTLYKTLGQEGRDAIKAALVKDAWDTAINAEGTKFSPAKWAGYFDRKQNEVGVFFQGAEKAEIDGFRNLMRHAERAGQYMENPPTGNRAAFLLQLAAGTGAYFAPWTTALTLTSALGLRALFTTEAGKRFLLSATKQKPGSMGMQEGITSFLTKSGLSSLTQNLEREQQESTQ